MALIFMALLLAVFVTLLYGCLCIASDEDDAAEEAAEKQRIVTDIIPSPVPEGWVRYNVPLDDDLQKYIEKLCREYEVPSPIVIAIIAVETGGTFDPELKGDYIDGVPRSFGLMQIWESEHHDRCLRLNAINLCDPRQNVRVGIDFLAELISPELFDGDWDKALSFYNNDATGRYAEMVQAYAECLAEGVMSFNE